MVNRIERLTNKKGIFIILIVIAVLISCRDTSGVTDSDRKVSDKIRVFEGIKEDGRSLYIVKNEHDEVLSFYINESGDLLEIRSLNQGSFRVLLDDGKFINSFENKRGSKNTQRIILNEENKEVIYRQVDGAIEEEVGVVYSEESIPFVRYVQSYSEDNLRRLSMFKSYDFLTGKVLSGETTEFISLRNMPDSIAIGKKSIFRFDVESNGEDFFLLKGGWIDNFSVDESSLDTIRITKSFDYEFTPSSENDTIRFAVLSNSGSLSKKMLYELPVSTEGK